jgi:hypothetical protein
MTIFEQQAAGKEGRIFIEKRESTTGLLYNLSSGFV